MKTVQLPDRTRVPVLGQGTWRMGENKSAHEDEVAALRLGIDLEMYGDGDAEKVVATQSKVSASAFLSSRKCIRTTHRGANCRRHVSAV